MLEESSEPGWLSEEVKTGVSIYFDDMYGG
jgi:hypothetical protein